jgi:RNA polymerase sigma-70 factor (ECF subfamily)
MSGSGQESTHRTIERVARESYGRLVAYLSSHTRDVASAEDALSNALVAALTTWPQHGVPQNPEAWLLTTARSFSKRADSPAAKRGTRGDDPVDGISR